MAAANSTRTRGVQIDDCYWGRWVKGTRDKLIEHGYTQDVPFPGDAVVQKTVTHSTDPVGRAIKIRRASKFLFVVSRKWNEEEASAFRMVEEKRRSQRDEIERSTKLVASWPKSANAFRDEARCGVDAGLRIVEKMFRDGALGGYRYDDDTILRARLLAEKLQGLIDTGAVVKDLMLKEAHTPACIAKSVHAIDAAKQDKGFQRFMADVAK